MGSNKNQVIKSNAEVFILLGNFTKTIYDRHHSSRFKRKFLILSKIIKFVSAKKNRKPHSK